MAILHLWQRDLDAVQTQRIAAGQNEPEVLAIVTSDTVYNITTMEVCYGTLSANLKAAILLCLWQQIKAAPIMTSLDIKKTGRLVKLGPEWNFRPGDMACAV